MNSAREEILTRIAAAHAAAPPEPVAVPRSYHISGTLPPGSAALLDLLSERLVDYRATVHRCAASDLAATVAAALRERGCRRVAVPPALPTEVTRGIEAVELLVDRAETPLSVAELDQLDGVITECAVAIATTGTIVLDAGPDQGRRAITLVPDYHLVVVRADQVVETVPEGVARIAAAVRAEPPRPLTMISGPSATSDIELVRVEGVHGPRTLVVVLVTE